MTAVLTLIAACGLDDSTLSDLRQTLAGAGASLEGSDWLAMGRALDLRFRGLPPAAAQALAAGRLQGRKVDVVAQAEADRKKRLLIADMDSTMVVGETLDDLAAHAGLKDHIAAITARSMLGEIDFKTALRERVALLEGLDDAALAATEAALTLMPGAATLIATMRQSGATCVLVSGGFDRFTARVRQRLGFDADHANRLEIIDGKLSGRVAEPILDREAKLGLLQDYTARLGLRPIETMAVGDGANDLAMISAAGLGVAYHAKPLVAAAAAFRVDHSDLTALLFAQGYRTTEWA
jgi:phosphoserine phosphatase